MSDTWPRTTSWWVEGERRSRVIGDPVAWKRPQPGNHGNAYTHDACSSWRKSVRLQSTAHAPPQPYEGGIILELDFLVPQPKSDPKWLKEWRAMKERRKKPDLDNYSKAIKEALEGLFYKDDAQVSSLRAVKLHAPIGASPGVKIRLQAWPPYPTTQEELEQSWYTS